MELVASDLARLGVRFLRGGTFKPRSSPYSFQGLGQEGLEYLAEAREQAAKEQADKLALAAKKAAKDEDEARKLSGDDGGDVLLGLAPGMESLIAAVKAYLGLPGDGLDLLAHPFLAPP